MRNKLIVMGIEYPTHMDNWDRIASCCPLTLPENTPEGNKANQWWAHAYTKPVSRMSVSWYLSAYQLGCPRPISLIDDDDEDTRKILEECARAVTLSLALTTMRQLEAEGWGNDKLEDILEFTRAKRWMIPSSPQFTRRVKQEAERLSISIDIDTSRFASI